MPIAPVGVHIYEEALWEDPISSHHILGPPDDLLLQWHHLLSGPEKTGLLPV